jgi:hypothetical protein
MTKSVRAKLTEKCVRDIVAPTGLRDKKGQPEQKLYLDEELKGFCVVASGKSTSKSYAVQRDVKGRSCRKTIGPTNAISLVKAREMAAKYVVEMIAGIDPKKKVGTGTVAEVLGLYLKSRKNLRPKSVEGYRQAIEQLNGWSKRPIASITQEEVEKKHAEIAKRIGRGRRYSGKASANASMRALRAIYNFALDRDADLPRNPVRLKKVWFPIERRETIVEDKDKPKFYEAVWTLENESSGTTSCSCCTQVLVAARPPAWSSGTSTSTPRPSPSRRRRPSG